MIFQACPDLSNLTKNQKTTNNLETMDFPSESNKQHLDKVLTFIGSIGAEYLTYSMIVQKVDPDLSNLTENRKLSNLLESIHTTS